MTQKQLGAGLGWAQAHVSEIENGKVDPRLSNVVQMARLVDHELMLIPTALIPAVRAMISGKLEQPLWSIEEEDEGSRQL